MNNNDLFEKAPISKAYFKLALPVVLSMVISLVYNMVDTYFVAQTQNTNLVAGVSLCAPIFTLMIALGDMEFVDDLNPMFFAEAKTKVKTLALSLKEYKENLNQDFQFLHTLLNSIAAKLKQSSTNQFVYQSVEERFLHYIHYYCKGSLKSIEEAINYLHCSRRQLQRILKKLCDEEKIIKEGKGRYKIKG